MTSKIKDLQLAAYLIARGYRVLGVDGPPNRRVLEINVGPEEVMGYYGGDDKISARLLFNAYRDIRGLVSQGQ